MKRKANYHKSGKAIATTESYVGEPLEEKIRRVIESNAPIEAISPEIYTERKEGVRPEMDIRTDRFDVALNAMDAITEGVRSRRAQKAKEKEEANKANADEPKPDSEVNESNK